MSTVNPHSAHYAKAIVIIDRTHRLVLFVSFHPNKSMIELAKSAARIPNPSFAKVSPIFIIST